MSTDDQILDVIAKAFGYQPSTDGLYGSGLSQMFAEGKAAYILAALRDAGYDVGPSDTFKLGRAVQARNLIPAELRVAQQGYAAGYNTALDDICAEAGVERP